MRAKLFWMGWAVAASASSIVTAGQPVLVELFTSEGCSSCPPADALLEKLDRTQPVAGAQIIVLSEHVDYWDHDGWKDRFSSPAFTARQEAYGRRFGVKDVYTPEMVVDGATELNGSDAQKAESAIRQALAEPKVDVRIRAAASGGGVTLEAGPLPEGKIHKANVYVARAVDSAMSDVLAGENRGRTLHHVSIVEEIRQAGSVGTRTMFTSQIPLRAGNAPGDSRWIAFVQEPGTGRILGAAVYTAR